MRSNRTRSAVLLLLLVLGLPVAASQRSARQIPFIQFKKITLVKLFDYLATRYGVNIVLEPQLKYYVTDVHLKNVSVAEVIDSVARRHKLWHDTRNGTHYVTTRRTQHEQTYYDQRYAMRSVTVKYASIADVTTLLKDVMHGTAVVRSSTVNEPYNNLYDATPTLQKITSETITQTQQSGSGNNADSGIFPNQQSGSTTNTGASGRTNRRRTVPTADMSPDVLTAMMLEEEEQLPMRILYIVPFFNENKIFLLSRDVSLIEKAEALIAEVDRPIKEVLIQGKIISVGIDDGFSSFFEFNRRASELESQSEYPNSVVAIGNLQYSYLDSLTNANIEILQSEGKARTIASPMLLTANRAVASLDLVEQVSIIRGWTEGTVTQIEGGGAVTTQSVPQYSQENIGTQFEIIPYINDDDEILLKITITISTLKPNSQQILVPNATGGYDTKQLDGVSKTTIETTLVTQNGRGIVLGGLINETVSQQEDKVPLLGDIPLLGFFFKDVSDETTKSETVVILTPFITDLKRSSAKETVAKVRAGIESERHVLGDDEPDASGLKLLDNAFNYDVTGAVNEARQGDDTRETKIEAFLKEER